MQVGEGSGTRTGQKRAPRNLDDPLALPSVISLNAIGAAAACNDYMLAIIGFLHVASLFEKISSPSTLKLQKHRQWRGAEQDAPTDFPTAHLAISRLRLTPPPGDRRPAAGRDFADRRHYPHGEGFLARKRGG